MPLCIAYRFHDSLRVAGRFPASRGDFMKYIRGLSQSDLLVIVEPVTCREPGNAGIHSNFQKDSNCVSSTQKTLIRWLAGFSQLLPAVVFLLLLGAVAPVLGQSTFGSVRG